VKGKPNVLLIFSDQQHWQAMGFMDPFFDMKNDPDEVTNLAQNPECAGIRRNLAQRLEQWIEDHNDPFHSLHASSRSGGKLD
jgi:arylsulfatase A-like enzyme